MKEGLVRTIRWYLFPLLFVAFTAAAQTAFVLDRIDINPPPRVRAAILLAETRLRTGRSYSVGDVEQAIYRLRRLPFVLYAGYTLTPGSSPSAQVLTIAVVDVAPLNYAVDVDAIRIHGSGGAVTNGALAQRFFAGSRGVLDLTAGGTGNSGSGATVGSVGTLGIRYTLYGLFGTRAYASAAIATRSGPRPSLLFGIPLTRTQTIRARYDSTRENGGASRTKAVEWLLERTDDPFFARSGESVVAGPQWTNQDLHLVFGSVTHPLFADEQSEDHGWNVAIAKYWPLAERSALWARATGTLVHEDLSVTGSSTNHVAKRNSVGDGMFGVAHNFGRALGGADERRGRFEAGIGWHQERNETGVFRQAQSGAEVSAGFAYRSLWGVVRVSISYTED
jgi:hypothetical protein